MTELQTLVPPKMYVNGVPIRQTGAKPLGAVHDNVSESYPVLLAPSFDFWDQEKDAICNTDASAS